MRRPRQGRTAATTQGVVASKGSRKSGEIVVECVGCSSPFSDDLSSPEFQLCQRKMTLLIPHGMSLDVGCAAKEYLSTALVPSPPVSTALDFYFTSRTPSSSHDSEPSHSPQAVWNFRSSEFLIADMASDHQFVRKERRAHLTLSDPLLLGSNVSPSSLPCPATPDPSNGLSRNHNSLKIVSQ